MRHRKPGLQPDPQLSKIALMGSVVAGRCWTITVWMAVLGFMPGVIGDIPQYFFDFLGGVGEVTAVYSLLLSIAFFASSTGLYLIHEGLR